MLIEGIHVPLTAPFYADGSSYLRKLEHNVRRYSLTPASALLAFGPEMEADGLSDAEIAAALTSIAEAAATDKVLIAGLPRTSVRSALAVAIEAEQAGFDAVLVSMPLDAPSLKRAERLVWLRAIADRSPLPVMLWSGKAETAPGLSVSEAQEVALHPNVLGMYDAALTVERYAALKTATTSVQREVTVTPVFAPVTRRMLRPEPVATQLVTIGGQGGSVAATLPAPPSIKTRTRTVGFQVMAAVGVQDSVRLLQAGVPGWLPALAAAAPQGCHEVYAAFKDGDPALAELKAARLVEADGVMASLGIAGIKYGCDLNGYYGGYPRLPRLGLTADERRSVEQALAGIAN